VNSGVTLHCVPHACGKQLSAAFRKPAVLIYFSRPRMNSKHGFYVTKHLTAAVCFKSSRSSVNKHPLNMAAFATILSSLATSFLLLILISPSKAALDSHHHDQIKHVHKQRK